MQPHAPLLVVAATRFSLRGRTLWVSLLALDVLHALHRHRWHSVARVIHLELLLRCDLIYRSKQLTLGVDAWDGLHT